ncbi:MAG: putative bifunctional diguanylate cyclase/phosphodiesterase [Candidatus Competibacterales bacterium]
MESSFPGLNLLWPPAGLAVALFWLGGWYLWAVVLGELLIAIVLRPPSSFTTLVALGQLFEAALAVWALQRNAIALPARGVRDIVGFSLLAVAISPAVGGVLVLGALVTLGELSWSALGPFIAVWWLRVAMGIFLVAPALLYAHNAPLKGRARVRGLLIAGLLLTLGYGLIELTPDTSDTLFFLLLPLVALAALYSGGTGVGLAILSLGVVVLGLGLRGDPAPWVIAVHVAFVGSAAFMGYLIAAVLDAERRAKAELARQAERDPLTDLPNRRAFQKHLAALEPVPGRRAALLYLDLDQFKLVNDTGGHGVGDRLLVGLAQELAKGLPRDALLARLGGDEFGVLLAAVPMDRALALAEELRQTVLDYSCHYDNRIYRVGVSIGVALFQPRRDDAADALNQADIACYAAKRSGRNRVHCYDPQGSETLRIQHERRWVARLQLALREGQFGLVRQRIFPLATPWGAKLASPPFYEVLLRLNDQSLAISPAAFMEIAELHRFVNALDRWVIEEVFRHLALDRQGTCYSINLSGVTLEDGELANFILDLQDRYGVNPSQVCFEITERTAIQRLTRAIRVMELLQKGGFQFALDDFGSGVASFGYLQQLPVHYVKLDGQFVRGLDQDPANAVIVRALIELSHLRGLRCVAEAVETQEALDRLQGLGVDLAQGHFLHLPEPLPGPVAERL